MERNYSYAGFDIHVAVQACASTVPRRMKMPEVGYTAVVTITKSETRTPSLPQIHLAGPDGRWFPTVADTLFAAGRAGQRAVDDLLDSCQTGKISNLMPTLTPSA